MKKILGLDLGTNSIGWALVQTDDECNQNKILKLGSRIIPMSQKDLGLFDSGVTETRTKERTSYRSKRRIRQRSLLRRERLLRVLHVLGFLPDHFDKALGWDRNNGKTYGKFIDEREIKLAWTKDMLGKSHFIFMDSFMEMVRDFQTKHPELMKDGKSIPMDWTLYFLRDKALHAPISRQEFAWILLNFNQKRGYYQLRGEEEEIEDKSKRVEYHVLKVVDVEETKEKRGKDTWYNVQLENGWIYRRSSRIPLTDWIGKTREFIVTTELEPDGSVKRDKEGKERRSFRAPDENDWNLQKKRTEADIEESGLTVGSYIYRHLLNSPSEKVLGRHVRTIERKYYREELKAILQKQATFIPELTSTAMLEACIHELYAKNIAHQESLLRKDLSYLLIEDLIFYQRPLKSKKSLIANCPYEQYEYVDKETGEIKVQHIKCVAKSNPYYQEFRLWQFIHNLRIFSRNTLEEKDVTKEYMQTEEDYVGLFHFLNDREKITQEVFLKEFLGLKKPKGKDSQYPCRWNYVEDKEYPCNETRHSLLKALKKTTLSPSILNHDQEYALWHLLYSVEDKNEILKALNKFAHRNGYGTDFIEAFKNFPSFRKEYGAYSEKATKKLLSVMRMGSLWNKDYLPENLLEKFQQYTSEETDVNIQERISKQGKTFVSLDDFQGLPVWMACYVIYGRHSESKDITRWKTPEDIKAFLSSFKQYSLRNPVVEQCVLETLRTVHDIWKTYGKIDEIHVELGRSMKSTADQRRRMTQSIQANENTNIRIKQLLLELKNDNNIKDVRPFSPTQQEILRIYEEGALMELKHEDPDFAEISRISSLAMPTQSELLRYKLWLDQKYRSPYTGKAISLTKLFTPAYQIEHIIPKTRFYDDSFSNKVICEAEVNQLKSNQLGYEFILSNGGRIVSCPTLGDVRILTKEEYKALVAEHYAGNRNKARKLLMDDIPENFVQRQMNDSRYISRVITGLLSNLVREEGEVDATSKHVIPCTGGITDKLKKDWGLNNVWNTIVSPRFQRMNELTASNNFGHWENKDGKQVFQTSIPLELQRGFSKKRIDHRHHAMDALVIALASRNIVSYLNNESARDTKRREDLKHLLCDKGQTIRKPWATFTQDALKALSEIVVSFKHYVRVINKASNYYEHYDENGVKKMTPQKGNELWAIRKPLHKDTVFGHVNLQRKKDVSFNAALDQVTNIVDKELRKQILLLQSEGKNKKDIKKWFAERNDKFNGLPVKKVAVYYFTDDEAPMVATRKILDNTFDEKRIQSITDTGIQKILLNYLHTKGGDPQYAFSPEGIAQMNLDIALYNGGKPHKPILRVRVSEPMGEKYNVGIKGNKCKKFVEAQSGTNLYFAIYEDAEGKRTYQTVPMNYVAERQKQGFLPVPERNEMGTPIKFWLSPNDLVYVPNEEERERGIANQPLCYDRVYKMVSATGNRCFFIQHKVANVIMDKIEFQSLNKIEKSLEGDNIKETCWKLEVDRLGNITKIIV